MCVVVKDFLMMSSIFAFTFIIKIILKQSTSTSSWEIFTFVIQLIFSGILIGREVMTSLRITAYEKWSAYAQYRCKVILFGVTIADCVSELLERDLRCFDTVFLGPYRLFKIGSHTTFSLSDRREICTSYCF